LLPKAIAEWIEDRFAPLDKPYHPEDFKDLIISPPKFQAPSIRRLGDLCTVLGSWNGSEIVINKDSASVDPNTYSGKKR
jgi:hypothetical protein